MGRALARAHARVVGCFLGISLDGIRIIERVAARGAMLKALDRALQEEFERLSDSRRVVVLGGAR